MRMCEIRCKEVINTCNCKKLGCIIDVEINLCKGTLEAILVPESEKPSGWFGCEKLYYIPYECIKKVGEDLVFVEICEEKCIKVHARCKK